MIKDISHKSFFFYLFYSLLILSLLTLHIFTFVLNHLSHSLFRNRKQMSIDICSLLLLCLKKYIKLHRNSFLYSLSFFIIIELLFWEGKNIFFWFHLTWETLCVVPISSWQLSPALILQITNKFSWKNINVTIRSLSFW